MEAAVQNSPEGIPEGDIIRTLVESPVLSGAWGMSVDSRDRLIICSSNNNTVVALNLQSLDLEVIAGTEGQTGDYTSTSCLNRPRGICCSLNRTGITYIADCSSNCIKECDEMLDKTGNLQTIAGTGKPGQLKRNRKTTVYLEDEVGADALEVDIDEPEHVCLNESESTMLISSQWGYRIYAMDMDTRIIIKVWNLWNGVNGVRPLWTCFDSDSESKIWVSSMACLLALTDDEAGSMSMEVVCGNVDGIVGYQDGPSAEAKFEWIRSCMIIPDEGQTVIYMCDEYNQRIRKYTSLDGMVTTIAGNGSYAFRRGHGLLDSSLGHPIALMMIEDDLIIACHYGKTLATIHDFPRVENLSYMDGGLAWRDQGRSGEFNRFGRTISTLRCRIDVTSLI